MKPLVWMGNSLEELATFPRDVCRSIGYALHFAQAGDKHPSAKPLKGFGGAGVHLCLRLQAAREHYRQSYAKNT
jgi:phage-related protein